MEECGAERVEIAALGDKRQITAALVFSPSCPSKLPLNFLNGSNVAIFSRVFPDHSSLFARRIYSTHPGHLHRED